MAGWVEKTAPGLSSATIKLPVSTAAALVAVAFGWRLVWFLARQWPLWLAGGLTVLAFRLYDGVGAYGLSGIGGGVVVALVVWGVLHRRSFVVCVYWPLRGWLRGLVKYGRGWGELMAVCGLSKKVQSKHRAPRLLRTKSTSTVDRVRVKTLRGQTLADFAENTDRFAESTGAVDCRVRRLSWPGLTVAGRELIRRRVRARVLDLWFLIRDPLADLVPLFPVPDTPNLKRLPLALGEDGRTWTLRLLGRHVLIAGQTGSGKSGVVWSLVRALGPAVRDGSVELWVIDPKGGMELAAGQALFARYCYGDKTTSDDGQRLAFQTAYAEFLESLVDQMRARQQRLRGIFRTHRARPGDPHVVALIDELAALTSYVPDRKVKARIEDALNLLLSQGRACGISVVAALQDARKEVANNRGLFPTRIGLALGEEEETDLILGATARKNGARCDQIDQQTPGVGYVAIDEAREPVRVRFAYVDDDEITRMTRAYQPNAAAVVDPYPADPIEETHR